MRQAIRAAEKEGFKRIAVVCGAWHCAGAGDARDPQGRRRAAEGPARSRSQATWIPWTYSRLSYRSGYGAGIDLARLVRAPVDDRATARRRAG